MADDPWYSRPYKGGPMVPVPGFPRELRAGDVDGRDAIAYKRTAWRAGRWQGPASRFDDTYSRNFACGAGPNVVDTGIAGIQRQQEVPDDGVIDKAMFNTLRSIRCPPGPHEGEMAMDANAQTLIAEAYRQFNPPPAPKQTTRERALDGAVGWLGYVETGNNDTVFGSWYGVNNQPYCAIAVTYWYEVEAGGSPSFVRGQAYAYVPYIVSDGAATRNGLNITNDPVPGDLVAFDWGVDGTFDHVGLFEKWSNRSTGTFVTCEANTSPEGSGGSQSNGGGVYRRNRDLRQQSTVFVRVAE